MLHEMELSDSTKKNGDLENGRQILSICECVCLCQLHSCHQKRFPIEMLLAQLSCQCSLIEFVCPTLNGAYRDCRINRTRIDCRQCPTIHKHTLRMSNRTNFPKWT